MDFDQVKKYWEERASIDSSAQSTTQDYYMREIEFEVLKNIIKKNAPYSVMDVGCGDARTTARLAGEFHDINFTGGDYSESMVMNAQNNIDHAQIENLKVFLCDVSKPLPIQQKDMVYTTRCLINLPTWELQKSAIENIANSIISGGHYVMIENFIEGQNNFNEIRKNFGLQEIPVRDHNLFFRREELLDFCSNYFNVLEEINISSTYYLVTRAVYSKICQDNKVKPDYFDSHHKYAAQLPFSGEYGPVRMICMERK